MITFLSLLKETESSKQCAKALKNITPINWWDATYRPRTFEIIQIGDYKLSIQASVCHYCEPARTLDDLTQYKSMEIAIVKGNKWIHPKDDEYIRQFTRYDELIDKYQEGEQPVGEFVPVDLIEDLIEYLRCGDEKK